LILLLVPPRIVAREPLVGVLEGRSFEMRCDVTAYPKPIVYWLHEGKFQRQPSQLYGPKLSAAISAWRKFDK